MSNNLNELRNVLILLEKQVDKKPLKEAINQPDYQFYVCEILNGTAKINEGFVDKEDASYRLQEQKAEGHTEGLTFKVLSGKFLKSKGIDPNNDRNWGNPSYIREAKGDKKFDKVMDEYGKGTLKTGSGKKVDSQKQAVAIGFSEKDKVKNESEELQETKLKKLKNVLIFLEEKADKDILKEGREVWLQEKLDRHFELEKKMERLRSDLDKYSTEAQGIYEELFGYIDSLQGKQKKLGEITLKIKSEKIVTIGKNSTKWQKVFVALNDAFDLEQKIVKKIVAKWSTKASSSSHIERNLEISKGEQYGESIKKLTKLIEDKTGKKVIFKEGLSGWLSSFVDFIKNIIGKFIGIFGKKVENLEFLVNSTETI